MSNPADLSLKMEPRDYAKCKAYIDHAMSYKGGLNGDGHGQLTEIESAIGALLVGQMFGYRVLQLVHSPATCKKYARLLGVESLQEVCPATNVYSQRHHLFRVMQQFTDWWRNRYKISRADRAKRDLVDTGI
ncbi:MAG: hypothetical protein M1472_05775 [Planctomycetes bacterium]|jgi:hypothetical protein|nr:hypothetical protein [Planctomycetota bacterium]